MGAIDIYAKLLSNDIQPKMKQPVIDNPKPLKGIILPDNAVQITMADSAPATKDLLASHVMKNYRRKPAVAILTPDLEIEMDCLFFDIGGLLECNFTL